MSPFLAHELYHFLTYQATLQQAKAAGYTGMDAVKLAVQKFAVAGAEAREQVVYQALRSKLWDKMSTDQKKDAIKQAFTQFGRPEPGI